MADSADVQRTLDTARAALSAPAAARARVLKGLAASGALQTPAPRGAAQLATAAIRARGGTLVMIGAAFIGGYWFGGQRAPERTSMDEVAHEDSARARVNQGSMPAAGASGLSAGSFAPRASDAVPAPAASLPERVAPNALAEPAPLGSPSVRDVSRPRATRTLATSRAPLARSHTAPTTTEDSPIPHATLLEGPGTHAPNAFAGELALLSRADRAIRAGEAELALSFVNELDLRYPDSKLTEERGAARIMAECALAAPGAVARAERFLSDHPASVYSDRVLRSCGIEVAPARDRADGSRRSGH